MTKPTTAQDLKELFGRVDWEKVLKDKIVSIIKEEENKRLMTTLYGSSFADSISYGDKYIVVHKDGYQKLIKPSDNSFLGKLKYGWRLFALSVSDWKDAMMCENYTEEFFWFLGRGVDL